MLRLNSEITIGNIKFTFVTNVTIQSSWESITDTAIIEFPNKIRNKSNTQIIDIINVNDPVTIKLGYHPNLKTEFTGFISKIVPESPLKVFCEDEAFLLKQTSIRKFSKKNLTLEQLITDNFDGAVNIVDAKVGAFRIENATLIAVLQELRTKYGIYSWFRDGVLNSGLAFTGENQETEQYKFQRNIINGKNLRFIKENDLNTISHGISIQPDGKKIERFATYSKDFATAGQIVVSNIKPEGDLNTYKFPELTESELDEIIKRRLPNLNYTGYRGNFLTFGEQSIRHGDVAQLTDLKFPERDGKYLVKSVNKTFGQNGYRQEIELDQVVQTELASLDFTL